MKQPPFLQFLLLHQTDYSTDLTRISHPGVDRIWFQYVWHNRSADLLKCPYSSLFYLLQGYYRRKKVFGTCPCKHHNVNPCKSHLKTPWNCCHLTLVSVMGGRPKLFVTLIKLSGFRLEGPPKASCWMLVTKAETAREVQIPHPRMPCGSPVKSPKTCQVSSIDCSTFCVHDVH